MRIERMKKVNEYVEQLRKDTRAKIRERMSGDEKLYKDLLKNLLIQVSISKYRLINSCCFLLFRDWSNLWSQLYTSGAENQTYN